VEAKRHGIGYTRLRGELVAVVDNRSGEPRRKLILLGTERGQDGPGLASFSRNAWPDLRSVGRRSDPPAGPGSARVGMYTDSRKPQARTHIG